MSALQITLGAVEGTNWPEVVVTALVPAAVGAGAALFGVWLTNRNAALLRKEEAAERQQAEGRRTRLSALALAVHLESFAINCASVVSSFWGAVWETPYTWARYASEPKYVENVPPWPPMIEWELLGADLAVASDNFQRRVELERRNLSEDHQHLDGEDVHARDADLAAQLGLAAWEMATAIRTDWRLEPFKWPDGQDGEAVLKEHLRKRAAIKLQQERLSPWPDTDDESGA